MGMEQTGGHIGSPLRVGGFDDRFVNISGIFPCGVGCTSFIVPADILPNVTLIAPFVDDVELLIFESDRIAPLPSKEVVEQLIRIAKEHNLTYTVHLPTDIALASPIERVRRESVEVCLRAIERLSPLDPFAWVLHLSDLDTPQGHQDGSWQSARKSLQELSLVVDSHRICVETLTDDLSSLQGVIKEAGISVCLDVGHLALGGYDLDAVWEKWHDTIRVVHMHGVDVTEGERGKDHKDLRFLAVDTIAKILNRTPHNRVTTIEVFGEKKLRKSLEIIETMIQEKQ